MIKTCPDCHATTVLSTSQPDEALGYATRLLEHFVAEHFPHNPDWKPLPDLIGVLTQLDNAITIARDYKDRLAALAVTPAVGGEALRETISNAIMRIVSNRDDLGYTHFIEIRDSIFAALAAPPASPLRGRKELKKAIQLAWAKSRDGFEIDEITDAVLALFASPPEHPAADDPFQPHENCNCMMCLAERAR